MKTISIISPCFNEEGSIEKFATAIHAVSKTLPNYKLELLLVDDGSSDETKNIIKNLCINNQFIKGVFLSRNFGKEAALTAGLDLASGDAIVFIDSDLQHPPELISKFINLWENGNKMVVGRRLSRSTDSRLYRFLAKLFYSLHNKISDVKLPLNAGDFRLIDRSVANELIKLRETRRFMKGLFSWVGFSPVFIDYEVQSRFSGASSFNKWKSWNFALEGITSFSTAPLRIWLYAGAATIGLSALYLFYIIANALIFGVSTPGYITLITAISLFGGIQLIGIGILGEYIGRIYIESKQRPIYLIDSITHSDSDSNIIE
jgi:glycosyltransferase involved in cell wall biosynthesis